MSSHLPQRKSPRLRDYDYTSSGLYFVTICTHGRNLLFGGAVNTQIELSPIGKIADTELSNLSSYWQMINVDCFVVMPNHVHAIIIIDSILSVGGSDAQKRVPTLGQILGNFKAGVTRMARREKIVEDGFPLWQERYHDRIIRGENELNHSRAYILENPDRWLKDELYV